MIIDGKEEGEWDEIFVMSYSPEFRRTAYNAAGKQRYMVVDGQSMGPYDVASMPVFSGDSKHMAFAARGSQWFVVMDGQEEGHTAASPPRCSALTADICPMSHKKAGVGPW